MEFSPTYTLLIKRGLRFSAASHCRINNGSAGLDEQPSLERNSEKPCHLELVAYLLLVRPLYFGKQNFLYRHGCLQDKSNLLSGLCTSSRLLLSIRKSKAREKEVVPSSLVTLAGHIECSARHRICRKRGSGEGRTTV